MGIYPNPSWTPSHLVMAAKIAPQREFRHPAANRADMDMASARRYLQKKGAECM
jgi:hypothetical protein